MKNIIKNVVRVVLNKFGYTLAPLYTEYLEDVICTGNLLEDLSTTLGAFIGQLQTVGSSDVTRSKIRLELTKVLEKYTIQNLRNDKTYYIESGTKNNTPESIDSHKLLATVNTSDECFNFTLSGGTIVEFSEGILE